MMNLVKVKEMVKKEILLFSLIASIIVNFIYIFLKNNINSCDFYGYSLLVSLVISGIVIIFAFVVNDNKMEKNGCFVVLFNIFNFLVVWLTSYIPYPASMLITRCDSGRFLSGMGYFGYFLNNIIISVVLLIISFLIKLFIKNSDVVMKMRKKMKEIMNMYVFISLITSCIVCFVFIFLINIINLNSCELYEYSVLVSQIISVIVLIIVFAINNNKKRKNVFFVLMFNLFNILICLLIDYIPYLKELITRCDSGWFLSGGWVYVNYIFNSIIISVFLLILSSLIRLFIRIINKKRKM